MGTSWLYTVIKCLESKHGILVAKSFLCDVAVQTKFWYTLNPNVKYATLSFEAQSNIRVTFSKMCGFITLAVLYVNRPKYHFSIV